MWIIDLVIGGFGSTVLPFLTSLAGLAVPGAGALAMVGGAILPQTWRVVKIAAIGFGLAGVAIYILVIKLDALGAREAKAIAETEEAKAKGDRDLYKAAVAERDRNMAAETARLQACAARTQENLAEITKLQADHRAALEAQARAHRAELKQRQSLFALKEKLNAVDQACPGPLHPADRDYVVWMCERARGRGESPAACAAGN